jgi:uncharacterized protein YecE (DUF72 family)
MDFGRLPEHLLDKVNFALPPDPPENKTVLNGVRALHPQVFVGCTQWAQKEWKGQLYPAHLPADKFLEHYSRQFNCVELNATHYQIFAKELIAKWADKTPDTFRFCPKMYQGITHADTLLEKEALSGEFLDSLTAFESRLGPVFIQVSDAVGPQRKEELFRYLESLPRRPFSFFLEVRHAAWFAHAPLRNELFSLLAALNIGAVITDVAGRRDVCHMQLSVPRTMIRFQGDSPHPTDEKRLNDWVRRITYWLQNGLQEVYFFMHQHHEIHAPEMAAQFIAKLNTAAQLQLMKPSFEVQQGSLF